MDEKTWRDALNYVAGLLAAGGGRSVTMEGIIMDADKVARYISGGEIPDSVGMEPKKPYDIGPGMAAIAEAAEV